MLLMRYSGVSFAVGFTADKLRTVWIRIRCSDFASLKNIAWCAVSANVVMTVGDPDGHLCCEPEDATDLPFDVQIIDQTNNDYPTQAQIFGVFLARCLKLRKLIDSEVADGLQRGWNSVT